MIKERCKTRAQLPTPLTVRELNRLLDQLASADGTDEKKKVVGEIFSKSTAQEQRWVLRIITKDMHIGMKEEARAAHRCTPTPCTFHSVHC